VNLQKLPKGAWHFWATFVEIIVVYFNWLRFYF
ncbi:unnamed protein product, partial [marine sediment metagenome]